jgi:hypothetical protein
MSESQERRSRGRLIAAVRDRLRYRSSESDADRAASPVAAKPSLRPTPESPPDPLLEQLDAEASYHRDRYELYRARVVSGSPAATSLGRLRELERSATAAEERLAHARRRS